MKIKKLTALAMTTAMCAATIFGCGGSNEGGNNETTTAGSGSNPTTNGGSSEPTKVSLKVWSPQEDQDKGWIQKMCDQFNEAHPEWEVSFTYETCGEDKAAEMVEADPTEAADVYMFANDQLGTLLDADAIAKLGGAAAEYVKSTNSDVMVSTVTKDGAIYGIPYTANTWFMYYDKSVFSEDDIKSLDKMLEKGKVAYQLGTGWYFGAFYAAGGATFCGADGSDEKAGIVLGDKGTEVTKYLVNLVQNPNFVKDDSGSGLAGLRDGSISAMFSGTWDYSKVQEALGDNIGVAALPTININGEEGQLKAFAGSKALGVNPHSENMEVAVALALYLASEEAQLAHYEMRSIVPANTKLLESEAVKNDELAQAQAKVVESTAVLQPTFASFNTNFWNNATNMSNELLDGTVTLDNAAEKTKALEDAWNGR